MAGRSAGHAGCPAAQPPLTPLLARLTAAVTGNTLAGFRVPPALARAALVLLTAAMSRQLGACGGQVVRGTQGPRGYQMRARVGVTRITCG